MFSVSIAMAVETENKPLASVGSHWNYWVAQEYSFGYCKYKVEKDTVITAKVYGVDTLLTANASLICKYASLTNHASGESSSNMKIGEFYATRIGNASYVYGQKTKEWFKWIDMDAKPGDRWVATEITTGKGMYDYVEVSFLDTLQIDGKDVPCIFLIPSCESRFSTKSDYTSRIAMNGYFNIDYWSLRGTPEPSANGIVYTQELREINTGLLCADVNGISLNTERLTEYVMSNNKPYYDQGIINCDSLKAPIKVDTEARVSPAKESRKAEMQILQVIGDTDYNNVDVAVKKQYIAAPTTTEVIDIPVVVHVVHNPATPEEEITEEQVVSLVDALNEAYSTTRQDEVRDTFKNVVGNPYINFSLATVDPEGKPTSGVVYYETDVDYFRNVGSDIKVKYAYKFNADGSARNWDHTRYANIYVADFGGFDGRANIGGFVTNPEPYDQDTWNQQVEWYRSQNTAFWTNWLKTEEGAQLDGLTVDTWYTFGGKSAQNPNATFKTAIHELGHYFGLRHVSVQIVQQSSGALEFFDDGFDDTPSSQYNQYCYVDCKQDVIQCGELIQVENYMDYCLDCACMFTVEQAAFMRKFINEVRTRFVTTAVDDVFMPNSIMIYPAVSNDVVNIDGLFNRAAVYSATGMKVADIEANQSSFSVHAYPAGVYIIRFFTEDGVAINRKFVVDK